MTSVLGVPQGDFRFTDGGLYCVLDQGGLLSSIEALEDIAWECGSDLVLVSWRPTQRGELRKIADRLLLSGYEGVLGVVPADVPNQESDLLTMLLDIGDEVCEGCASALALGLRDSVLSQGVVASCLVTCGYTPISRSVQEERTSAETSSALVMRFRPDMVLQAITGAQEGCEEEAASLVAEFTSGERTHLKVGF